MLVRVRDILGNVSLHWLVRYVIGPGLLATAPLYKDPAPQWTSIVSGLLIVEGANVAATRRRRREESHREKAGAERDLEAAHRHIAELLSDAVTVFEARRPADQGRFRANVMLVEGDVLRMAYKTPGYLEAEEALEWRRGEGCVGRAWESGQRVLAPTPDAPLPRPEDAHQPTRPWGMTSGQVLTTAHVEMIISVPILAPENPGRVVALFNLDDAIPPSDYGAPVFQAAEGVAARVGQWLEKTGLQFPATSTDAERR